MGLTLEQVHKVFPPPNLNIKFALLIDKHQQGKSILVKFCYSDYQIYGSHYHVLHWLRISEEIMNTDFVKNLCDRDMSFVARTFVDTRHSLTLKSISSGYNLSKKEYERIEALFNCLPKHEEFISLSKYP